MRLGDVITINPESIHNGYPFDEIEYIDISSLGTGIVMNTQMLQLAATPSRAKRIIKKGDTLLATVRPNLRSFWFARNPRNNAIASTGFAVLRAGNEIEARFLYYSITNQSFTDYLSANAKGSAYPAVDTDTIRRADIYLPPLPSQHKIVAILSTYDDLIENNLRRIKILGEMAQNLYREWFVKFLYPGHEHASFTDSTLGFIPEGWEVVALGDLAVVITKGTTPTTLGKEFYIVGINFVKVESILQEGGIDESKLAKIDYDTHKLLNRSQLRVGDILFSIAGAIGRTTIVPKSVLPANTNQALAIIRIPDENTRTYILHCVRADEFQHFSLGHVVQTAQANVSLGILKSAPIMMPPKGLLGEFAAAASSLIQMQENLRARNITIRRTRDLLLPRLISGEVDVSELDIAVPQEAA